MTAQVSVLPNGLRIVSDAMPSVETVAVGVWADVGARHEPEPLHGISHLLEHMAFKGTRSRSARRIAEEIEAVGGYLNAYTGHSVTAFYARALKEDLPLAIHLLADILQNSIFEEGELEREREVVIQEIAASQDTPDDVLFDHLQTAAFAGQALGRPILGTTQSVAALSREALKRYFTDHYAPARLTLSAAGAVEHDRLVELARQAFPEGGTGPAPPAEEPFRFTGGERLEARPLEQLQVAVAIEGVGARDDAYFTQWALNEILGGGMSSRLFQSVRETHGLAYSVQSFARAYADGGMLGVYAGVDPARGGEALALMLDETERMAAGVSREEAERARAQIRSTLLRGRESPYGRAEAAAEDCIVYGAPVPQERLLEKVAAVSAESIRDLARRLLAGAKPAFAAVGPVDALPAYSNLTRRFA